VIDGVVSPVLHSNVPVKFDAVSVDVPSQLSVTVTVGAAGALPGFAIPLPLGEVHPAPRDCVTVYVPAVVTVIDGVVSPVLHSNVPVKFDAVSVDVPSQLSVTVTVGAAGALPGFAIPLPLGEVHPAPRDCVTVYVPAVVTVIDWSRFSCAPQ
jgi:nitrate/nitrite transporter NarK